jgi:hypothetical protein
MPAGPEASAPYGEPMWKRLSGRETNNGKSRMKTTVMSAWMMVVRQRWKPTPMLMLIPPRDWL